MKYLLKCFKTDGSSVCRKAFCAEWQWDSPCLSQPLTGPWEGPARTDRFILSLILDFGLHLLHCPYAAWNMLLFLLSSVESFTSKIYTIVLLLLLKWESNDEFPFQLLYVITAFKFTSLPVALFLLGIDMGDLDHSSWMICFLVLCVFSFLS